MNDNLEKSINLNNLYELIDLYKYASIDGEKVELIVYPTEDNKRIITIGLQNGFSRDRDTFIIEDGDKFDKDVLPQILSYYSCDDSLGNWDIVEPEIEDTTIKASNETTSGNIVYLDTKDSELINKLSENVEDVKEKTTYKKEELTNEDKIWDEIILYAKGRRVMQDFFVGSDLMPEELSKVYDFVTNISEENKVNIGTSKKARENNEKYLSEVLKDNNEVRKYAELYDATIESINNPGTIKKLAKLVGVEKRIRKRLDLSNEEINNKIIFAVSQLDKVDFFSLKNGSVKQFEEKDFIDSKPKAINELINLYDDAKDTESLRNKEYCQELLGYLERKAKNNSKIVETKIEQEEITFEKYDNSIVDSYDELEDALDLIQGAKLDNEHYEIIVEHDRNDSNAKLVRISLIDGPTRSDTFNFKFNNGEEFDKKIKETLDSIYAKDPKIKSTIQFVSKPFDGQKMLVDTSDGNEILLKNESNIEDIPKEIEKEEVKENEPKKVLDEVETIGGIPLEQLQKLEKEITDYSMEQEKNQNKDKDDKNNSYGLFDIDLATYEILVDKYKDKLEEKFYKGELEFDEYQVVHKIFSLKDQMLDYYNNNYDKSATLPREEVAKFAECELYLTAIYTIEAKYKNNKQRIEELSKETNLIPAGKILLSTLRNLDLYSIGYEKNMDNLVEFSINKYEEIMNKYNDDSIEANNETMKQEKEELLKMITYKYKLSDAYNELVFRQDELNENELKTLANYETRLSRIYEIDARHQNNVETLITELNRNKKFLTPSSKIWLTELIEESKRNALFTVVETKKEDKEKDYVSEVKDSYEKVLSYSTLETPAIIQILFEKGNKNTADLIISNKVEDQNIVEYQRTFDIETLEKDIMPVLGDIYSKDNELKFNIKMNVAASPEACLLLSGIDHKELKITYAPEDFVDKYKKMFEEKFENNKEKDNGSSLSM